jgi:glycosyltransferase involved in cell wall biosynthesis
MNIKQRKIHVAVVVSIMANYREGFYDRLFNREDLDVTVYCQDSLPNNKLVSIHNKYVNRAKVVKYISTKNDTISWQFLPWVKIINNFDVVFVEGNPRVLSNFFISTLMRFLGKDIVLWTMAHSCRANYLREKIRLKWSKMFKKLFVYTDAEVEYLRINGFKKNFILGMNNGLDQKKIDNISLIWDKKRLIEWRQLNKLDNKMLILSCARLLAKNQFELIAKSLPEIINNYPDVIWCVIGSGDEKKNLVTLVKKLGLENNVRFVGSLYREDELAPWFLSAALFVHPAAIGLSLMHAFGYGLPVITHGKAELHNPEYAAFKPGLTGLNFNEGDSKDLANVIAELLRDEKLRDKMSEYVLQLVREKYNVDIMVNQFVSMIYERYV